MDAGKRDRKVVFERYSVAVDDYGGETQTWSALQEAWAQVKYGTAQERRQAAQEASSQTATFEVDPSTALLTVGPTDRIVFEDDNWDIQGPGEQLDRHTLRFTATRSI